MAKEAKKKPKPVIKSDEPVISETPVIGGEQATADIIERPNPVPARNDEQGTPPTIPHEAMTSDIQTISIPEVKKEPEPIVPSHPVICAGCKATVSSSTTRACINCKGSLVFCPLCATAGSCHKCGKALSK